MNAAVGIIGSEDNEANLMYGGVIAVGAIGTAFARFKPEGMSRTLLAMALAQALVAVIALVGRMGSGTFEVVAINGFFVALFIGSAVLFSNAARGRLDGVAATRSVAPEPRAAARSQPHRSPRLKRQHSAAKSRVGRTHSHW